VDILADGTLDYPDDLLRQWISTDRCLDEAVNDDLEHALWDSHAVLVFGQPALAAENLMPAELENLKAKNFLDSDLILKATVFSNDSRFKQQR
jgi:hypothetical protein